MVVPRHCPSLGICSNSGTYGSSGSGRRLPHDCGCGGSNAQVVGPLGRCWACTCWGFDLGVGQAMAAASALTAAFGGTAAALPLMAFVVLAVLRAILFYLIEKRLSRRGRRRGADCGADALSRLLHAGPALLRNRHSVIWRPSSWTG